MEGLKIWRKGTVNDVWFCHLMVAGNWMWHNYFASLLEVEMKKETERRKNSIPQYIYSIYVYLCICLRVRRTYKYACVFPSQYIYKVGWAKARCGSKYLALSLVSISIFLSLLDTFFSLSQAAVHSYFLKVWIGFQDGASGIWLRSSISAICTLSLSSLHHSVFSNFCDVSWWKDIYMGVGEMLGKIVDKWQ